MPWIDQNLYQPFGSQGYAPLAMHVGDDVFFASSSAVNTGTTYSVIVDYDSVGLATYGRVGEGVPVFPLAYLIDRSGIVRDILTVDEPDHEWLVSRVQELLAE